MFQRIDNALEKGNFMKVMPLRKFSRAFLFNFLLLPLMISGYIYLSPYLSILAFRSAIEQKNAAKISGFIDFPSVRLSLKRQIKIVLNEKLFKEVSRDFFTEIKVIMLTPVVEKLTDSIVDATITPGGLKLLLSRGELSNNIINKNNSFNKTDNTYVKPKFKLYYVGFNKFVLSSEVDGVQQPIVTNWKRIRFSHWNFESIELPLDLLNQLHFGS